MGYTSIAAKLVELLEGITAIAVVYDHDASRLASFPAATVIAENHRDSFYDTAANRRTYTYLIRLYHPSSDDDRAEEILRNVVDTVIETIESNVTVPGVWDIARPTMGDWTFGEREMPMRIVEVRLTIESRVLR